MQNSIRQSKHPYIPTINPHYFINESKFLGFNFKAKSKIQLPKKFRPFEPKRFICKKKIQ